MKDYSSCGKKTFLVISLLQVLLACLSFIPLWWGVYFWDCLGAENEHFVYLVLNNGLCRDDDVEGETGADWDNCKDWGDVQDDAEDSTAADDAGLYLAAKGMTITVLALSIIMFQVMTANLIIPDQYKKQLRYVAMGVSLTITLLLLLCVALTSATFYTNPANYDALNELCSENVSFPALGWAAAVIGLFLSAGVGGTLLYPCCDACWEEHNSAADYLREPLYLKREEEEDS